MGTYSRRRVYCATVARKFSDYFSETLRVAFSLFSLQAPERTNRAGVGICELHKRRIVRQQLGFRFSRIVRDRMGPSVLHIAWKRHRKNATNPSVTFPWKRVSKKKIFVPVPPHIARTISCSKRVQDFELPLRVIKASSHCRDGERGSFP